MKWLHGGQLGSLNTMLIFRSSELANATDESIQAMPAFKLHVTYKLFQTDTKLLTKLLDCHGAMEVANNSSDFNLYWTGQHPKPGKSLDHVLCKMFLNAEELKIIVSRHFTISGSPSTNKPFSKIVRANPQGPVVQEHPANAAYQGTEKLRHCSPNVCDAHRV